MLDAGQEEREVASDQVASLDKSWTAGELVYWSQVMAASTPLKPEFHQRHDFPNCLNN